MRDSWPVDGTTGYDFLNRVAGIFVDPEGEKALTELYAEFMSESTDWAEVARARKHQVMREIMGSDLNRLTALFLEICERRRRYRDYTRHELHEALRDTLACFPVYRTYVRPEPAPVDEDDARRIVEDNWMNTTLELPPGRWRSELDGHVVQGVTRVADLLARFPVALLSRIEPDAPGERARA